MWNPSSSSGGKAKTTTPCCSKVGIKRGPWTPEEDELLANFVRKEGEGRWRTLPKKAGLLRCGKSCRLRWMNYLRPSVKRGRIAPDEEDLILRLHRLLGNRWSLIAGRIPGRTDNEIKNYWNTHLSKKLISQGIDPRTHKPLNPHPISSIDPQDNPKSTHFEETGKPYRVIATKLTQNFNMMTDRIMNEDDQYQNPILNDNIHNWPGGNDALIMGLQNGELGQSISVNCCIENGNPNNEDIFSSFLDSLIHENENVFLNHHQQQQNLTDETLIQPINVVSGAQNFDPAATWEAGFVSSLTALGERDAPI